MSIIYITGLSGVGKSTVLKGLFLDGYHVIDTDYGYTKYDYGNEEVILDEVKFYKLIDEYQDSDLFISGCYANQGKFYKHFKRVVLLTANLSRMLNRVENRTNNPYGKTLEEKNKIIASHLDTLPLLKKSADLVIDTTNQEIKVICELLKELL